MSKLWKDSLELDRRSRFLLQGRAKNLAKFSDTCSVRADGLCIVSPRLVGGRKAEKFKHARMFLRHAVNQKHLSQNFET